MSKIKIFLLLLVATFMISPLAAQVKTVSTNLNGGEFTVTVKVGEAGFIIVNSKGRIIDMRLHGNRDYYSDFHDYEAGKIKSIGGVRFTYYSDFYSYESGKIKSIGDINFSYYSDFFDYESGKLKKIGDTAFTYYSNFNDYEAGKIKSVGRTNFSYYSNFNSYESGKLKKIGSASYTYFSNFDSSKLTGKLKSGNDLVTENGINFRVKLPQHHRH